MADNPYEILGVARTATADEIKKAYRALSKQWHPDKHKGEKAAEEKYKKINQAYELLSDPKKRQMYDQYGSAEGPTFGGAPFGRGFEAFTGFEDLFATFFGGGSQGSGRVDVQGHDIEVALTIALPEAYSGLKKTVRMKKLVPCETCRGSGAKDHARKVTCSTCSGTGQVVRTAQSFFGMIRQSVVCDICKGSGRVPEVPCNVCRGEGRVRGEESVTIEVPPGIAEGQTLRLRGKGEAGRQGVAAGDLFVHVRVESHPRFVREGDDLHTEATISITDAILGTEIPVETLGGSITLKIVEGTQPHQVLRIKGKGMPVLNTMRHGDLYVRVNVEVPKRLSRRERELWEELRRGS